MTVEERTSSATEHTPGLGQQWVYRAEDAPADYQDLLGGKGAGLAAMTQAGLPVPPAITITTAACNAYQAEGGQLPPACGSSSCPNTIACSWR